MKNEHPNWYVTHVYARKWSIVVVHIRHERERERERDNVHVNYEIIAT